MWNSGLCNLPIPAHRLRKEGSHKAGKRFMNAAMYLGFLLSL